MKSSALVKIWIALILLTILSAIASQGFVSVDLKTRVIVGLAFCKMYLVSFYFMELKKAHVFWKSAMILFMLFLGITLFVITTVLTA